jgi:hypothetical protein
MISIRIALVSALAVGAVLAGGAHLPHAASAQHVVAASIKPSDHELCCND